MKTHYINKNSLYLRKTTIFKMEKKLVIHAFDHCIYEEPLLKITMDSNTSYNLDPSGSNLVPITSKKKSKTAEKME